MTRHFEVMLVHSKNEQIDNEGHGDEVHIRNGPRTRVPYDAKCMTSQSMAIVIIAVAVIFYEKLAKQTKFQTFDLESKSQGQEGENRNLPHLVGNVRIFLVVFGDF